MHVSFFILIVPAKTPPPRVAPNKNITYHSDLKEKKLWNNFSICTKVCNPLYNLYWECALWNEKIEKKESKIWNCLSFKTSASKMDPIYITKETPIRIITKKQATNSRPIAVPIVAVRSNRDVSFSVLMTSWWRYFYFLIFCFKNTLKQMGIRF